MNRTRLGATILFAFAGFSTFGCAAGVESDPSNVASSLEQESVVVEESLSPAACIPNCGGRRCGADPVCGQSCGTCGTGETCDQTSGQCTSICVPNCNQRSCGLDPVCGTSCGTCANGETCDASGQCKAAACVPDCSGRTCGADPKCGTSCGVCGAGGDCNASGVCVYGHAPVAIITSPKTAPCDAATGKASVVLDGSRSSDPDGDSLQYTWTEGTTVLATTAVATANLGVGSHTIVLTVRDATGLADTATASVSVSASAPVFTSAPGAVTVSSCSADAQVSLPRPAATDRCAAGPVVVSGEIVWLNGVRVAVPIAGTATLPAGTAVVRWTARADGLATTADQVVTITEKWGLLASRKLELGDGAKLLRPLGGFGLAINAGTMMTSAGVESRLGNLSSIAPVTLRDRAKVFGSVTTAATLTKFRSAWIRDAVTEHASIVLPTLPGAPSNIPKGTTDIFLQPDRRIQIAPGAYRYLSIASRSTARLSAGTYYIDFLDLEPQSVLALEGSGPVQIFVRSGIILRGTIFDPKNQTSNVRITYLGNQTAYVESPFFGLLSAPNGSIVLRATATPHVGSFFAKDLFIDAHATVTARPDGC